MSLIITGRSKEVRKMLNYMAIKYSGWSLEEFISRGKKQRINNLISLYGGCVIK